MGKARNSAVVKRMVKRLGGLGSKTNRQEEGAVKSTAPLTILHTHTTAYLHIHPREFTMRYTLSTSEENILKAQKLPKSRQSLSNHRLYKSASKWGSKHQRCLRVQHLDDLPFERFFDGQIPISDNDECES